MTGGALLGAVSGLSPRALPASERGEDRAQAGKVLVLRRLLLVVNHQQALRPRACLFRDGADGLAHFVRLDVLAVVAVVARLLGKDAGSRAARARLRLGRGLRPPGTDHQLAMGATSWPWWPSTRNLALDQQETMGAISLHHLPCRGSILNHPCPFLIGTLTTFVPP